MLIYMRQRRSQFNKQPNNAPTEFMMQSIDIVIFLTKTVDGLSKKSGKSLRA